jgi:hypothetical protein
LAKSWTTVEIFVPQNADFLIASILRCIGNVNVDKGDKIEVLKWVTEITGKGWGVFQRGGKGEATEVTA